MKKKPIYKAEGDCPLRFLLLSTESGVAIDLARVNNDCLSADD